MKLKLGHGPVLEELRTELLSRYPELVVTKEHDLVRVRGSFPIVFQEEILDRFLIDMEVSPGFPDEMPVVQEIGGRVPRSADRHTERRGEACTMVREEWLCLPREQRTVLQFLDGPVRNYFLFQALTENGQKWPWGERPHGRAGLLEAYEEMLGVGGDEAVRRYFKCLSREILKGHWDCPCGSGKRLRYCHAEELRCLKEKVSPRVARSALDALDKVPT